MCTPSAGKRIGSDLRTSIRARGVQGRISRPDTRQHPTTLFKIERDCACILGGVHTRPVTVFGLAAELSEVLEIIPEISPGLSTELSDYGTDGDHYRWRKTSSLAG